MAATTTYTDTATGVRAIGARTSSTGGAVSDVTAEEDRLAHAFHVEGAVTTNAFKVAAQTVPNMTVKVGSGTAKADVYVVDGDATGQGKYMVRLDAASQDVTVSASEPAATRTDEIYLVVLDSPYDANTLGTASAPLAIPRLAYRKGDAGGANPGPDALWKAYALLARITVGAAVTTITNANITDTRPDASFVGRLGASALTDLGDVTGSPGGAGHSVLWNGTTFEFGKPGLIQYVSYHPGSPTTIASPGTSAGDLDSSNLVASFTGPASGAVLVRLSALVGSSSGKTLYWCLRSGSSTVTNTTNHIVTNSLDDWDRKSCDILVTGLTPGVTYTWKWGAYHVGSAVSHGLGGTEGPMVMEVFRA